MANNYGGDGGAVVIGTGGVATAVGSPAPLPGTGSASPAFAPSLKDLKLATSPTTSMPAQAPGAVLKSPSYGAKQYAASAKSPAPTRNLQRIKPPATLGAQPARPSTEPLSILPGPAPLEELCAKVLVLPIDDHEFVRCVTGVRKALSETDPPVQRVLDSGVLPSLMLGLKRAKSNVTRFEILWTITNLASGTHEQTERVVRAGAIDACVNVLRDATSSDDMLEQAIWALGNIAGDSPEFRDCALDSGTMTPLVNFLTAPGARLELVRNGTWALTSLVRGKDPAPDWTHVQPALSAFATLIHYEDDEVVADACWGLSYLTDGSNDKIHQVIEAGVTDRLVRLLGHTSVSVLTPALRAVGNMVTGDDQQTQAVINSGVLPQLANLLQHSKESLRKESAWAVSNVTAGNMDQIRAVLGQGLLLPRIIQLIRTDNTKVMKECLWALGNLLSGADRETVVMAFKMEGCVEALSSALKVQDPPMLKVALDAMENVLRSDPTPENPCFPQLFEQHSCVEQLLEFVRSPQESLATQAYALLAFFGRQPTEPPSFAPGVMPIATGRTASGTYGNSASGNDDDRSRELPRKASGSGGLKSKAGAGNSRNATPPPSLHQSCKHGQPPCNNAAAVTAAVTAVPTTASTTTAPPPNPSSNNTQAATADRLVTPEAVSTSDPPTVAVTDHQQASAPGSITNEEHKALTSDPTTTQAARRE
eukprot:m.488625 g.488625  ORF g.488625 m.488625 type:complete len:707 (+) comp25956_c0_seq1:187-2307(+)